MADELESRIAIALKRSKVLRKKGQDPDTAARIAAGVVLEDLKRDFDLVKRAAAPGFGTGPFQNPKDRK